MSITDAAWYAVLIAIVIAIEVIVVHVKDGRTKSVLNRTDLLLRANIQQIYLLYVIPNHSHGGPGSIYAIRDLVEVATCSVAIGYITNGWFIIEHPLTGDAFQTLDAFRSGDGGLQRSSSIIALRKFPALKSMSTKYKYLPVGINVTDYREAKRALRLLHVRRAKESMNSLAEYLMQNAFIIAE